MANGKIDSIVSVLLLVTFFGSTTVIGSVTEYDGKDANAIRTDMREC